MLHSISFLVLSLSLFFFADIWNFVKVNVPGPNLYLSNPDGEPLRDFGHYKNYHGFCERLRLILVMNIDTTALIFKKYFVEAMQGGPEESQNQNGHC